MIGQNGRAPHANEIMTVGAMQTMLAPLVKKLEELQSIVDYAADRYYTIEEAAKYTGHCTKVVRNWIKDGKAGRNGKKVKLPASEFAPGKYRISRKDLDAFGRVGLE